MFSLSRKFKGLFCVVFALAAASTASWAGTVSVPNASFESPVTAYAGPMIDDWQQTPIWTNLETGIFSNDIPGQPPIDNADGNQVAFIFVAPGTGLFLDYGAVDWEGVSNVFTATYQLNTSYTLTIGVLGGTNLSEPMAEGTTLELGLYYRDDSSNIITIASTTITNSGSLFPSAYHLIDFQVQLPAVQAANPWAGKYIGIEILSTTEDPDLFGGYWDLDNVRLTTGPTLTANSWTNGQFSLTVQGYPGAIFEILATTNPATRGSNWTSIGTVTNLTGTVMFTDAAASGSQRYYRARQAP